MAKKQGKSLESTALSTFMKLLRCSESVANDVHRHLGNRGLTVSQYGILEALYHLGPLCQGELVEKILKSNANLTTVVDSLEKKSLVRRDRSGSDRRRVIVHLTKVGEALIARVFPRHAQKVAGAFACLSNSDKAALAKLLKRFTQDV